MALVLATGCNQIFGLDDPPPLGDAARDTAPADGCWGTEPKICVETGPAGERALSGTLDTSSAPECDAAIGAYCVIAAERITVAALAVSGARPLVLIGATEIVIDGELDVASHVGAAGKVGPAAAASAGCTSFAREPTDRGGGAGGSFGGVGGAGNGNDTESATLGGLAAATVEAEGLRAGCAGQDGGLAPTSRGGGGRGGGAAYLIAGARLEIAATGKVNASGAGGGGAICLGDCDPSSAGTAAGAGGGGSGGMLILHAPAIAARGFVIADGGGGGEGASRSNLGRDGTDPDGTRGAPGGAMGNDGAGDGGAGSHASTRDGAMGGIGTSNLGAGGGGGGGGAGVIRVYGSISGGGTISPAPELH